MANYFTNFAFQIPASKADAERFVQLIEAANAIDNEAPQLLGREIEAAFRSEIQSGEQVYVEILDDMSFGIDCLFDETSQRLTIFDSDGSPNLWALAQCLQRLYPEKLPLGFVYSENCDKARVDGFGGGFFKIAPDTIYNETLAQILATELAELPGAEHGQ
jgi:hypothetical protein